MADMVPDEIEPAPFARGAPHNVGREGVVAQIAGQRDGASAGAGDVVGNLAGTCFVDIHHRDGGAFDGEAQRTRPAHTGARCCNNAGLALQTHGCFSVTTTVRSASPT